MRQYQKTKVDPKDNGLRVPWRVVEKEGKKKEEEEMTNFVCNKQI